MRKKPKKPLTEQQKLAIKYRCIDGLSVQQTASMLNVHRCTIWRWSQLKAFRHEWEKQCNIYLRQWRRDSHAEWNAELKRLENRLEIASAKAKGRDTKALNTAWNAYSRHLSVPIDLMIESRKRKMAHR